MAVRRKKVMRGFSDTVTIACNLPNGLVPHDHAGKATFTAEGDHSGGAVSGHLTSNLKGAHHLTPGCPLSVWQAWSTLHRNEPVITNRCVYALDALSGVEIPPGPEPFVDDLINAEQHNDTQGEKATDADRTHFVRNGCKSGSADGLYQGNERQRN
jgi:hypothetical protein